MTVPLAGHVAILMATRDGARFLPAQLASIAAQTHRDWSLTISDDGSRDATADIAEGFARAHPGRVACRAGPGEGPAANFLALLADTRIEAGYVAFADQDDVWLPGKLAAAVKRLHGIEGPALYGGRTIVTDAALRPTGLSPRFGRPPGFANALVQSIAGGNTMVMNRAAHRLLAPLAATARPVAHDWWAYQVVSGAGGRVIWDDTPWVLYRQHGANAVGANMRLAARLRRLAAVLGGRYGAWNGANLAALGTAADRLTPDARATVGDFAEMRGLRGPRALAALARSGVYRQTRAGDATLALAAFLGRL